MVGVVVVVRVRVTGTDTVVARAPLASADVVAVGVVVVVVVVVVVGASVVVSGRCEWCPTMHVSHSLRHDCVDTATPKAPVAATFTAPVLLLRLSMAAAFSMPFEMASLTWSAAATNDSSGEQYTPQSNCLKFSMHSGEAPYSGSKCCRS